ncbi:MAG: hypothetical protein K6B70_03925 [Clostridia bacterium]|nr:hypothetical protein [Clostridia bacterium]
MIKELLQKILKSNSNSMFELYNSFKETYPDESGILVLLRDYIFSEEPMDSTELEKALQNML